MNLKLPAKSFNTLLWHKNNALVPELWKKYTRFSFLTGKSWILTLSYTLYELFTKEQRMYGIIDVIIKINNFFVFYRYCIYIFNIIIYIPLIKGSMFLPIVLHFSFWDSFAKILVYKAVDDRLIYVCTF